jgi:hypothetical protein
VARGKNIEKNTFDANELKMLKIFNQKKRRNSKMNYSETKFLLPEIDNGDQRNNVFAFSPMKEDKYNNIYKHNSILSHTHNNSIIHSNNLEEIKNENKINIVNKNKMKINKPDCRNYEPKYDVISK